MKLRFKAETNCWRKGPRRAGVILIELLPNIAVRYVDWDLGYEYNLYLSWLIWGVSVTLQKPKKNENEK